MIALASGLLIVFGTAIRLDPADFLSEGAMGAVENIARQVPDAQRDPALLADALFTRYAVQDAIARAVPRAVELLGGLAFISCDEIGYLAAAVNGLGFHPPARGRMAAPLARYLLGESLEIV